MKKLLSSALMLLCSLPIQAQQFDLISEAQLSATITDLMWADVNNDTLLDVLVTGMHSDSSEIVLLYKVSVVPPDTVPLLTLVDSIDVAIKNLAVYLVDQDLDNDLDILLSGVSGAGPVTMLAVNEGDFIFESVPLLQRSGHILKMADMDQDGAKELIICERSDTTASVSIFKKSSTTWLKAKEWADVDISSLEVFDFDKDGMNDLFLTGQHTNADSLICHVLYNNGNLTFSTREVIPAIHGITALADFDSNGYFDVVVSGTDSLKQDTTLVMLNFEQGFVADNFQLPALNPLTIFAADLNSDGQCDLNVHGIGRDGDTLNIVRYHSMSVDTLVSHNLTYQRWGDFDRDGDLDLLQANGSDSTSTLSLLENREASKNLPPATPFNPAAFKIFDRAFVYWEKPLDDHTNPNTLTFDLALQVPGAESVIGEFDQVTQHRLSVTHGNNGNRNFALLQSFDFTFNFSVQAIDNAYHAGGGSNSGICSGTAVECTASLTYEKIQVCKNEVIRLNAPGNAMWFSFSGGLIGEAPYIDYHTAVPDTVFSFQPGAATGCASVQAYTFEVLEKLVKTELSSHYVCEGKQQNFSVDSGWQQIEWSSSLEGFISSEPQIEFMPSENDTLTVRLNDGSGCIIERSRTFHFSKPAIELNGETFQIVRGSQVQLSASGGETYSWSPSSGLNFDNIANPLASPSSTTTYQVTVTDSLGCDAQANIHVVVEVAAFVPGLFTPNNDGNNDELKLFGLEQITNFTFTIHNREGKIVYETSDMQHATTLGWNGTFRGEKQPAGVYYWKVSGTQPTGRKLTLNGKSSGSIVLVR